MRILIILLIYFIIAINSIWTNAEKCHLQEQKTHVYFKDLQSGLVSFGQLERMYKKVCAIHQIVVSTKLKKQHYQQRKKVYKQTKKPAEALCFYQQFKHAKPAINNKGMTLNIPQLEQNTGLTEKDKLLFAKNKQIIQQKQLVKLYKNRSWLLLLITLFIIAAFNFVLFQMHIKRNKDKVIFKAEIDRIMKDYELKNIQKQLSPHFIFNALNNFWNLFKKEDEQLAYDFVTRLSCLFQYTIKLTDCITVPLKEELEFVQNFLEFEQISLGHKFDYHIELDQLVSEELRVIPMCIQTHVENALKHGIKPKPTNGLLQINIKKDHNDILVLIEDDGIGRERAKQLHTPSSGFGLKAQQQIIDLFNAQNDHKIHMEIIDLKEVDLTTCGTRIELKIPIHYSYSLN